MSQLQALGYNFEDISFELHQVCSILSDSNSTIYRIAQYALIKQDHDVLDTWFSSGLLPLSALGWTGDSAPIPVINNGFIKKLISRPTAKDINVVVER